jgi:hypothetical protein
MVMDSRQAGYYDGYMDKQASDLPLFSWDIPERFQPGRGNFRAADPPPPPAGLSYDSPYRGDPNEKGNKDLDYLQHLARQRPGGKFHVEHDGQLYSYPLGPSKKLPYVWPDKSYGSYAPASSTDRRRKNMKRMDKAFYRKGALGRDAVDAALPKKNYRQRFGEAIGRLVGTRS